MSFIDELKRRNVVRVGVAYAVAGWLLMQITDVFAPALRLPEWFPTAVAFLMIIGFPVVVFFAWAFEITPEGIKREADVERNDTITRQAAAKLDRLTISLVSLVLIVFLADRFLIDQDAAPAETPAEEAKAEDTKADDAPAEEPKAEDKPAEEAKAEDDKKEE